jgi:vacuolar-type H+-ATPase subunit E/Vma4
MSEALEAIKSMPRDDRYAEIIEKLILEGLNVIGSNDALVIPSKPDFEVVKSVASRLAKKGFNLVVAENPVDSVGGVVIASGDRNVIYNNTFEARLSRVTEEAKRVIFELIERV